MKTIAVVYLPLGSEPIIFDKKDIIKNKWKMLVIEHSSIKKVKVKIYKWQQY